MGGNERGKFGVEGMGLWAKKAWKVRGCGRGLSSLKFRVYAGVERGYVGVGSAWKVRGGVNKRKAG